MYKLVDGRLLCLPIAADRKGAAALKYFEAHPWTHKVIRDSTNSGYVQPQLAIDDTSVLEAYLGRYCLECGANKPNIELSAEEYATVGHFEGCKRGMK